MSEIRKRLDRPVYWVAVDTPEGTVRECAGGRRKASTALRLATADTARWIYSHYPRPEHRVARLCWMERALDGRVSVQALTRADIVALLQRAGLPGSLPAWEALATANVSCPCGRGILRQAHMTPRFRVWSVRVLRCTAWPHCRFQISAPLWIDLQAQAQEGA